MPGVGASLRPHFDALFFFPLLPVPRQLFPKTQLKLEDTMTIWLSPAGLELYHNDSKLGELASPFVGRTLCEAYLDAGSVSPSAREDMAAGLARFLGLA